MASLLIWIAFLVCFNGGTLFVNAQCADDAKSCQNSSEYFKNNVTAKFSNEWIPEKPANCKDYFKCKEWTEKGKEYF
jgi:hypothetical protein